MHLQTECLLLKCLLPLPPSYASSGGGPSLIITYKCHTLACGAGKHSNSTCKVPNGTFFWNGVSYSYPKWCVSSNSLDGSTQDHSQDEVCKPLLDLKSWYCTFWINISLKKTGRNQMHDPKHHLTKILKKVNVKKKRSFHWVIEQEIWG